jgi:glycerophosphoryl diester phosphodiesterase
MGHGAGVAAGPTRGSFTLKHFEVIAHRGANLEFPENTLPAFQRALEIGVQGIELDIQFTSDRVPVVHHDPSVADPSSNRRLISSLSLKELRQRSAAPTLDEVLELIDGRCRLYAEIKEPTATESVVKRLGRCRDWCAIHSFDHRVAAHAARIDPTIPVGILLVSYLVDVVAAMRAAAARDVWQQADFVDRALVEAVHGADGRVVAWTVNDTARAHALAALGVDAICTDNPAGIAG